MGAVFKVKHPCKIARASLMKFEVKVLTATKTAGKFTTTDVNLLHTIFFGLVYWRKRTQVIKISKKTSRAQLKVGAVHRRDTKIYINNTKMSQFFLSHRAERLLRNVVILN